VRARYLGAATVTTAGLLALAACTHAAKPSAPASGPSSGPPRSPVAAIAAAQLATVRAGSARVAVRLSSTTGGARSDCLRGADADDITRQQGSLQVQFPAPGSPTVSLLCPPYGSAAVVVDHGVLYEKVPGFPKPWVRLAPRPDQNFFDPSLAVGRLPQVSTATVVGTDTLRGTATTHYRVSLTDGPGTFDVWLDGQGRVREVRTGPGPFSLDVELYDFGTHVAVVLPPADQVHPISAG